MLFLVLVSGITATAMSIHFSTQDKALSATWSKTNALNFVAENNHSGSGYRDLEGRAMGYSYDSFGSFKLAFFDNRLKWRGFETGYFDAVVSQVEPQVSKVSEDIFFLSWSTPGGTDNVVVNLSELTVFAHLWSGTDSVDEYSDFDQIDGQILCLPSKACPFPEGAPTGTLRTIWALLSNSWSYDLPALLDFKAPRTKAHVMAMTDLSNVTVRYDTEDGIVTLQVLGPQTYVSVDSGTSKLHRTHVTKVGDGIYFISWLDERTADNHIVVDSYSMRVFDHVSLTEERGEQIFPVNCFASIESCREI